MPFKVPVGMSAMGNEPRAFHGRQGTIGMDHYFSSCGGKGLIAMQGIAINFNMHNKGS